MPLPSPQPLYIRNREIGIVLDSDGGWQPDYPEGMNSPWESAWRHPSFSINPNSCWGHLEPALAR
jgi:hypothetical protein